MYGRLSIKVPKIISKNIMTDAFKRETDALPRGSGRDFNLDRATSRVSDIHATGYARANAAASSPSRRSTAT